MAAETLTPVYYTKTLHKKLKVFSASLGLTMKEVTERAITKYINEYGTPFKKPKS